MLTQSLSKNQRLLLAAAGTLALIFWLNIGFSILRPATGSFLVKWIPTAILAGLVFAQRSSWGSLVLFFALLTQSLGAVILDFDRHGYVLYALGFTALAHIMFGAAFLERRNNWANIPSARKACLAIFLCFALVYGYIVSGNAPARMQIPVIVYMFCLSFAVVSSIVSSNAWAVFFGMLCFVFDDSIFSYHLFIAPIGPNHFITWPSYMAGQALVTLGFLTRRA